MPELSKVALQVDSNQSFPNNNNGYITPAILRSYNTNVIDSTVNQIQYTADSGSWNSKIDGINVQTASFQAKFNTIGSQSGSWITESETGSFARTNIDNNFTTNQTIAGTISASYFSGDGGGLTNLPGQTSLTPLNDFTASQNTKDSTLAVYTGSVDTKFTTIGSSTASLNAFTSSEVTKNITLGTYTASVDTKFSTLATYTASVDTKFSTLGTYTASVDTKFTTIGSYTQSQDTKNSTLATYTGSVDTKFTTLGSYTASLNVYTQSLNTAFTVSGTSVTFNGPLYITGGVYQNVVPVTITSQTASLDLTQGTYFTLTLANNTTTHIIPTNLAAGVSATLVITTGTNSTASLAPICLQPTGSAYSATSGSGKIDILSLVGTNASNIFVVSSKNMV
jgi:hypothetical protein